MLKLLWNRRNLLLYSLVLAGILFALVGSSPAYAISNPDSISVNSVRVFQNLWETGDQLYFVEYKVMYDTDPDEDPEETFLVAIYNGSELEYSRPLNYYDHNIISIYLTEEQALTWGGGYLIKVMGNPTYFSSLTEGVNVRTFTLAPSHWVEGTMSESRTHLGDWCIVVAQTLEDSWGTTLLTASDKLNSAGKLAFEAAVPGLQSVCSDIFEVSVSTFPVEDPTYNQTYQGTLSTNIGERLSGAISGLGDMIGVPGAIIGGMGLALIFFLLAGRVFVATGSPTAAVVLALPILILGNLIGLLPLVITFVAGFIVIVLAGIVFILGRFA